MDSPRENIFRHDDDTGRKLLGKNGKTLLLHRARQSIGQTRRTWIKDVYQIKRLGWLVDLGSLPDDPVRVRCLLVCKRPRCGRANKLTIP
jgi:hypothetical protein